LIEKNVTRKIRGSVAVFFAVDPESGTTKENKKCQQKPGGE